MDQKVEPVLSKVKCYKCGVAIYEVRLCLPVCVCVRRWMGWSGRALMRVDTCEVSLWAPARYGHER